MEHNLQPKHTHYVSLDNGSIHPALTSPSAYEDQHPAEWRPATTAEIEVYNASRGVATANIQPIVLSGVVDTNHSSPNTLQLDPEPLLAPAPAPHSPVQEAPLHTPVAPAPAPAPAPAIPPAVTE